MFPRLITVIAVKPPIVEGIVPNPNTHIPQNITTHHEYKHIEINQIIKNYAIPTKQFPPTYNHCKLVNEPTVDGMIPAS